MQIRIHLDGTFESLSASPKTAKEHSERIRELKRDVSIANKIAKKDTVLRKAYTSYLLAKQATKTPGRAAKVKALHDKVKALRAEIKELKTGLSSSRNATLAHATEQLGKAQRAKTDHIKQFQPRNKVGSMHGAHQRAVRDEAKIARKKDDEADKSNRSIRGLNLKTSGPIRRGFDKLRNLSSDDMIHAINTGNSQPSGAQNSEVTKAAGQMIGNHMTHKAHAAISKIAADYHAVAIDRTKSDAQKATALKAASRALNATKTFGKGFKDPQHAMNFMEGIAKGTPMSALKK